MSDSVTLVTILSLIAGLAIIRVTFNELDVRSAAGALVNKPSEEIVNAVKYNKTNRRFQSVSTLSKALISFLLVLTGGFGMLQRYFADNFRDAIWQNFVFMLCLGLGLFLIGIPFSIYKTFVIEAKYGFNRTSVATFITDRIKGLVVGSVILAPALLLLLWIYQQIPNQIWWIAFLVLMVIQLFMAAFGTSVILPLFNKLKQLPDGELREKILAMCKSQNYRVGRIFVMNSSKRSSKTNAFFSGLGKTKTIVLFDSLIEKHTTDEVVAVLGHEIGHDRLGHVRAGLILAVIQGLVTFGLFGWASAAPEISMALGGTETNIVLGIIGFSFLFSPLSLILDTMTNTISRRNEHSADEFSARIGNPQDIQSALKRLSTDNLSNPNPHPLYVKMYYSHPTSKQRIAYLQGLK
jgi:STE24 endopeptidase